MVPCVVGTGGTSINTLVNQLEDGNFGFCIYNIPNEMKYSKWSHFRCAWLRS